MFGTFGQYRIGYRSSPEEAQAHELTTCEVRCGFKKNMANEHRLYLRQNIKLEPLVDRWYAWPHLIPPATAARNIAERHLRIMESYINAPDAHAAAVKNRKLQGGPFMEFGRSRVEEVRALRDRTRTERSHLLELSTAISEL